MVENLKSTASLIGVGVAIGAIIAVIAISLGARPSGFSIGPIEFEVPTAQVDAEIPSGATVEQSHNSSTDLGVTTATPSLEERASITTYEVFANLSWQNTGIQISQTDSLRIIWDGSSKWRGTDSGDFSDPLGGWIDTTNPQYACTPLMAPEEAGWNALIAKIGDKGSPTNPFKQIPTGEGALFLAMNDCASQRFDNEGSVIVTIEVSH